MTTVTYMDLLRDPRWQRRRLEIMQRDKFRCRSCGDETTTLNVHHSYYVKGRKPWEYEDTELHTLCEPCHAETTKLLQSLQLWLGFLTVDEIRQVRLTAMKLLNDRTGILSKLTER